MKKLKWNEVAAIIGLLFAVLVTAANVFSASWYIPANLSDTAYSVTLKKFYEDSTFIDSSATNTTNPTGIDTVVTVSNDSAYIVLVNVVWSSGDPPGSWVFTRTKIVTADQIADAVWDTAEAGSRQVNYRSLTVDSGTVLAATGTGVGFTITGGATSGVGLDISTTAGNAAYFHAAGGNFHGLRLDGAGSGHGLSAIGGSSPGGSGIRADGGTGGGYGMYLVGVKQFHGLFAQGGDSIDGVNAAAHGIVGQGGAGVGAADNQGGYGIVGLGGGAAGTYAGHGIYGIGGGHGSGFQGVGGNLLGTGFNGLGGSTGGYGFAITSAAGNYTAMFVNAHGTGQDFSGVFDSNNFSAKVYDSASGSASISDADMTIFADTMAGRGMADGSRSYAVRRYAIDTSGDHDTLSGVSFTARTSTGSLLFTQATVSGGWADFSLDSGEVRWTATKGTAYIFPDTVDTITANDTLNILGYNVVIASPSDADYATVYGYMVGIDGFKPDRATIEAVRKSGLASDTADGIIISSSKVSAGTDSLGYFSFELMRTNQYDDTTKGVYTIIGHYDSKKIFEIEDVTVPSSGNLDLGTIIAVRKEN